MRFRKRTSAPAGDEVEVTAESGEMAPMEFSLTSRMRDRDRNTRRKLSIWDRSKYTLLLGSLFAFFWWQKIDDNPIKSVADAFWETFEKQAWVLVLLALEWVRQIHFFLAERWAGYYRFWKSTVFGRFDGRSQRLDPWTRFRLGRVLRWIFALVVVSVIVGQVADQSPVDAMVSLPGRMNDALPMAARLIVYPLLMISQFVLLFWFLGRGGIETYFPDDIETRFDDVWGQDPVREKIRENLIFLENPESIEARGGYTPGGILLYGPPGTGKTLLAEAAAGETGKPFVFVEPGAFINMFMGVGIIKVKSLFRKLRKLALRYGGVVVFFDEADSLGNRGAIGGGAMASNGFARFLADATEPGSAIPYLSEGSQRALWTSAIDGSPRPETKNGVMMMGGGGGGGTLQSLLAEMSGLKKPRGFFNRSVRKALGMRPKPPPKYRILVMMASNMPEALDEAMLRPGRIDRIYKVGYPTKEGRIRTYEGYLDKVRHELTPTDIEKLATMTPYATGARIKDTVNEALINAIRDGREVINWIDIVKAKQMKEHGLADDFRYVDHERHAIAVHEACHAVTAAKLRSHLTVDVATIERRGDVGGFVSSVPPEDRFTHWRSEYDTDIQVSLASLAGERMLFEGDNSSGVGGDMRSATRMATLMIGYWGMGRTFTSHAVRRELGIGGGGGGGPRPGEDGEDREEKLLMSGLGEQVEERLSELYEQVTELLATNRLQVLAVAHALETHLTITGDDVMAIIDGTEGPFIDGRGYYRPEAVEKLETYHAAVLDFRRRGLDDIPPLPEIEGVTGRIVSSVVARVVEPEPETVDATHPVSESSD
jgi:cell division protease FtsH